MKDGANFIEKLEKPTLNKMPDKVLRHKDCRGCRFGIIFHRCIFEERGIVHKCPCKECLIKVACTLTCEKRNISKESRRYRIKELR
jgi:hypothetical protein